MTPISLWEYIGSRQSDFYTRPRRLSLVLLMTFTDDSDFYKPLDSEVY